MSFNTKSDAVRDNLSKSDFDKSTNTHKRIWEIDSLRGVAIILMVFFHLLVDLKDYFGVNVVYYQPPWYYVGKVSAILFMLVSGISCALSKNNLRRGIKILCFGMVVTVATFFFVRELYIRFGILHFLGSAIILYSLFERLIPSDKVKKIVLWFASPLFLVLGYFFDKMYTTLPFLFPIGLRTASFATYDYYPLLPWNGVFLAGVIAGQIIRRYPHNLSQKSPGIIGKFLGWLGKKSLFIYILHQPILLVALFIVFSFKS